MPRRTNLLAVRIKGALALGTTFAVAGWALGLLDRVPFTSASGALLGSAAGVVFGATVDFWAWLLSTVWVPALAGGAAGVAWGRAAAYRHAGVDVPGMGPLLLPELIPVGGILGAVSGGFLGWVTARVLRYAAGGRRPSPEPAPAQGEIAARRCSACKRQPLHEALLHQSRSDGRPQCLCSRCQARRQRRAAIPAYLALLTVTAALACILLVNPSNPAGWIVLNICLLVAFASMLVVPHELGHALGAWLMGLRVFHVYVGFGLLLFDGRRWGIRRPRRPLPAAGGLTYVGHPDTRHFRRRHFFVILCGPLANALLLAAALWWLTPSGFFGRLGEVTERVLPAQVFAVADACLLALSLWPYRCKLPTGPLESDGLQLLTVPFLSPKPSATTTSCSSYSRPRSAPSTGSSPRRSAGASVSWSATPTMPLAPLIWHILFSAAATSSRRGKSGAPCWPGSISGCHCGWNSWTRRRRLTFSSFWRASAPLRTPTSRRRTCSLRPTP